MKKAIKINVETKSVEYVTLADDYQAIYPQIGNGCTTFAVPYTFENNDSMFVDDESLLRYDDIKGGFILEDWETPIVGNAIILGCDDEGDSVDVKSKIEEIREQLQFITEDHAKGWARHIMGSPRQIIVF
jgi:hypothetical protein